MLARKIAVPLLVKAVGGGGGRGLKRVDRIEDLPALLDMAAAEAGAAFGDARIYLEHYVDRGRHVEVQVLGDGAGRVIQLGERDCSVQRRYQKLIEETPAPGLSAGLRNSLQQAAVRFAERLAYRGAGTVEFIVDAQREAFYFLEMNARIQVEHPVTEAVTGIDLIAEQIAIADGSGLRLRQSEVRIAWVRHRMPGQRRGPSQRLQTQSRAGARCVMARGRGDSRGFSHRSGIEHSAVL